MIRIGSLRRRLFLWNTLVLTVSLIGLGFTIHLVVLSDLTKQSDAHLLVAADTAASLATAVLSQDAKTASQANDLIRKVHSGMGGSSQESAQIPGMDARSIDSRIKIFNPDGQLLFREWFKSRINDQPYDKESLQTALGGTPEFRSIQVGGDRFRLLSKPVLQDGNVRLVVQVAQSEAQTELGVQQVDHALLHMVPIAIVVAGLGGLFVSGASLRPVKRMVAAVRKIDAQNLGQRLTVEPDKELAELGTAFNLVLERLDSSFESQKRFIQDASHELRTPLTALKVNTSVALSGPPSLEEYRTALVGADRASDRMMRLVSDLLFLSRTDAKEIPLEMERVSVTESAEAVVEALGAQAKQKGVDLCQRILEDLSVFADRFLLDRLLTNLVVNALSSTSAGGKVSVMAARNDAIVEILVSDTGIGIPAEHLEHVFERFYRVDSSRTRNDGGTGLGLSICRSICEAHGGSIEISSRLNEGTTVKVSLRA